MEQDRFIPLDMLEDVDLYTGREVEAVLTRLALPTDMSLSDYERLMTELKIPSAIANLMWEEYPGTTGTISRDEVMALLGLSPALKAVDFQVELEFPHRSILFTCRQIIVTIFCNPNALTRLPTERVRTDLLRIFDHTESQDTATESDEQDSSS